MRLTTMTDYAMRLLMYLAHNPGRLCTVAEVTAAYRISEGHMMKVTHALGLAGFVETVRGRHGGVRLARDPSGIRLRAVVCAIEPDFQLVECFDPGGACALTGYCRLSAILGDALEGFLAYLDRHTLADLVAGNPPVPVQGHPAGRRWLQVAAN